MTSYGPAVIKEARALALPWLACLAVMVLPAVFDAPRELVAFSVPAYFLGTAALGALSMGHEYSDQTLGLLLSLPAQRTRLLAIKIGVLAVMLSALWLVAHTLVFGDARLPQISKTTASVVPVLCALFLAPWLTMACRSAIGGATFTIGIPGVLVVAGELLGVALYGYGSVMEAFRLAFVWFGTIALCAVGALMSWRTFVRLESIDGHGEHVRLPRWLEGDTSAGSRTRVTRRHPAVLLVQKELHLQQLPLVIAALFVVVWVAVAAGTTLVAHPAYESAFVALTFLYAGLLPMLIGAAASAGERQIGTLEWQITQPISTMTQWAVKVTVVLGLSLGLSLGLPMILVYLGELTHATGVLVFGRMEVSMVIVVALLASGSLYVSSLSSSALWALVMSIPAAVASAAFLNFLWARIGPTTYATALRFAREVTPLHSLGPVAPFWIYRATTWLLVAGFVTVALTLALENHRSADRAPRRVLVQLLALAALVTVSVTCMSTVTAFLVAMNRLR